MARIIGMDNYKNWPLIISCTGEINGKSCPASFEVSMPGEMTRIYHLGTPPQFDVAVECPLCGKVHVLDSEGIPAEILAKIPNNSPAGIMQHHD